MKQALRDMFGDVPDEELDRILAAGGVSCPMCGAWTEVAQLARTRAALCTHCAARIDLRTVTGDETMVDPDRAAVTTRAPLGSPGDATLVAPGNAAPLDDPRPRKEIGRYTLIEKVGIGGMGEVWRAFDPQLSREVAVKILHRSTSEIDRARFDREAKIAASLDHPGIVRTLDAGSTPSESYIVQEFVCGVSLSARLKESLPAPEEALRILIPLAEGVAYAHDKGVIHRDLKPANVLIDEADRPKLTDFGLARRVGEVSDLSITGQILGTPRYMSPETIRNPTALTHRADIYGLGTILYELLTRRAPIAGENMHQILFRVAEGDVVPVREVRPEVPAAVEAITMKCLARDPARRYPSAQGLIDDVRRYLEGKPISISLPATRIGGLSGTRLGPVSLEHQISSVPQGVLYRAYHEERAARLLVLVMRPLVEPAVERPMLEQRIIEARKLEHPGILPIESYTFTSDGYPLVMYPLLKGESLEQVLRTSGALDQEVGVAIARQLLAALQALHTTDRTHGYLTPGSVLIAPSTDGDYVKLVGTGLVRPSPPPRPAAPPSDVEAEAPATAANTTAITRRLPGAGYDGEASLHDWWSAPELLSAGTTDPRTDLYAAGVLLYQMLAGIPPFENWHAGPPQDPAQLEQLVPLAHARRDYRFDPRLEAVVRRAISRQPANRFQTAEAFSSALPRIHDPSPFGRALRWLPYWIAMLYLLFGVPVFGRPGHRPSIHLSPFATADSGSREQLLGRGILQWGLGVAGVYQLPVVPAVDPAAALSRPERPVEFDAWMLYCDEQGARSRAALAAMSDEQLALRLSRILGTSEKPVIQTFWIDKTEVSRAQYQRFTDDMSTRFPAFPSPGYDRVDTETADLPASGISWYCAQLYARWAGKSLPTNDQWSLAARGRIAPYRVYPWGDRFEPGVHATRTGPEPIATRKAGRSADDVWDLGGNVWEWTRTADPTNTGHRLLRGGSWLTDPGRLDNDNNWDAALPATAPRDVGLRCVYER